MATRPLRQPVVRRVLVALAAAACAVMLLPSSSHADPKPSIQQVARQLEKLQNQAEAAAERYNAAQIRVTTTERAYTRLQAKAAAAQGRLDALSRSVGALVTTLYRTNVGGSSIALLSAKDPESYLAQASAVESLTRQRADVLRRVQTARQELKSDQLAAKQKLALVTQAKADAAKAKADINAKVAAEKHLLSSLQAEQRAQLLAAQKARARAAAERARAAARPQRSQTRTVTSDIRIPTNVGHGSGRAQGAVAYALRQVGHPYRYAADGPGAYDCSGLTMAAYRSVGIYLPHQSSQQSHYGRHVASSDLQPGDLVFYYSPIHHVAIYIGGGRIVHAANPGEGVTIAGVFSMPYSGAVRVV